MKSQYGLNNCLKAHQGSSSEGFCYDYYFRGNYMAQTRPKGPSEFTALITALF